MAAKKKGAAAAKVPPPIVPRTEAHLARSLALTPALMQKKVDEYFACVVGFERQRDQWRDMYNDANRTHVAAQQLLEGELEATRTRLARAIAYLNECLVRLGEKPLLPPQEHLPGAPPIGEAQRTLAAVAELDKRAPKLQRALVELRKLRKRHEAEAAGRKRR